MRYTISDFAFDLRASLAPASHIWVGSGFSTTAPLANTVAGVGGLYSPPYGAGDMKLLLEIEADGHIVSDTGNLGKGDCGLLYAGARWQPDRIVRNGTYHYYVGEKLLSLAVDSELVPLADRAGFVLVVRIVNRMGRAVDIGVKPMFVPGCPGYQPLGEWDYGHPSAGLPTGEIGDGLWENDRVRFTLLREGADSVRLLPGEETVCRLAIVMTGNGEACAVPASLAVWESRTQQVWEERIARMCEAVPMLESDIPGLEDYYRRSLVSGLICMWDHPEFAMQPFPVVSGIEGAGICCYPWDAGGYAGRMLAIMLGSDKLLEFAGLMADSGIDRHSRFAPNGEGKDVSYAYSLWSFFNLVWSNLEQNGEGWEMYPLLRRLLLTDEERLPVWEELLDYGEQHNLLEMRSAAHQHVVSSPNAERAWCYDRLADMAEQAGADGKEAAALREKAERIRRAIRERLWDGEAGWFVSRYPDGHKETVYSIQAFDTLRMGACTAEMEAALLTHLREGAFLAPYGVSSISAEDSVHYELNDPDWSGGGSYTGECPILALILWEIGRPELAWDVLKRLLWMGKHLPYYPQEHYCDRPAVPAHKRANVIAGLAGTEAIVFGMAGLSPQPGGMLTATPRPPLEGNVSVTGYRYRDSVIDIHMKPGHCRIVRDGVVVYEGEPQTVAL